MKKRLLFIAYFYPPDTASGSNRTGALAWYLEEYGWEVTVVTVPHPQRSHHASVVEVPDVGVFQRLSHRAKLATINNTREVSTTNPALLMRSLLRRVASEVLYYPDRYKNWSKSVFSIIQREFNSMPFDIVLSSSQPESSHLAAQRIKQYGFARYWVADFRDLWTQNHYRKGNFSIIREIAERRLERRVMANADLLVTTSEPWAATLRRLHSEKSVEVITNGYTPRPLEQTVEPCPEFTIVHTGHLYNGRRDPTLLFAAISSMKQEGICSPGEIRVRFFGDNPLWLKSLVNAYDLNEEVQLCGRVSREQSLIEQQKATILLSLNWNNPAEAGTFTGKVFEYLQSKRQILAIGGPGGVLSDMLARTNAGQHENTMEGVKTTLTRWLEEFRQTHHVNYYGKLEAINQFSWPYLAQRYAELLERVVDSSHK